MNHVPTKTLVVIAGPTAVGKTAASVALAKYLGTVIISADSRQFYKEMSIGTAKPSDAELEAVKHYFIGSHSINNMFSVGDFEKQGLALLDELFKSKDVVLLVGGSGLFIKAITDGFDAIPAAAPEIRLALNAGFQQHGIGYLQKKLQLADPVYHGQVDLNNPQRIIRALEVFESTGQPFSSFRLASVNQRPFRVIKVGITMPRALLYDRINSRVDIMMAHGLLNEAKTLLPYRHLNALNTVGYNELFAYFDGDVYLPAAIDQIKQNTRRFAKRQLTWFRRGPEMNWFEADDQLNTKLLEFVKKQLA